MATITADTFLDDGTARTAGEAWTMNGAILTIRTDTRVHVGAPASMAGSIGATTVSAALGGGVLIDARNVRWMAFENGSSTVPAIGTIVSQGAVEGYLLGVWSSLTSAPTAPGDAMPSTGWLKFREVTGGAFAAGALTGISADSAEEDRVGWIEVVQRQGVANTVPRLGFYRTRGDWFELGTTTGSAGQIVQLPTNGGGANTHVPAVWIETGVGTGVYEAYPAIRDTVMTTTNLGTDARSKFVQTMGGGQVRIGNNGTDDVGFVPPAGCRIRVPNIFGRSSSIGSDQNNQPPNGVLGTRPDFTTTASGVIDLEFLLDDWYHHFTSAFQVRHVYVATFDIVSTSNNASPIHLEDVVTGSWSGLSIALTISACLSGGLVTNCKFMRAAASSNGHSSEIQTSSGLTIEDCSFGVITYGRGTGRSVAMNQCRDMVIERMLQTNAYLQISTCSNVVVRDLDHTDRLTGDTNTTTGMHCVRVVTSSDNVLVDGLTFGLGGSVPGYHNPYLAPFACINSSNIRFRNAGTPASPLAVASSALGPQYAVHDEGANSNVQVDKIFLEHTRTGLVLTVNTSDRVRFSSIRGSVGNVRFLAGNATGRALRCASNSISGGNSVFGTHAHDMFLSDTEGRIWFAMNEPTAATSPLVTLTLAGATGGFTAAGTAAMPTIGDQLVIEMGYFALGHTAFANVAPTFTGTNAPNFTLEFDADVGSGFSGTYQTLNGANLSALTLDPLIGVKLRLRITTVTAGSNNVVTYVRVDTVTTAMAQAAVDYPMDFTTLSVSGLEEGSIVAVLDDSGDLVDYGTIGIGESEIDFTFESASAPYALRVRKPGYNPIVLEFDPNPGSVEIPVSQVENVDIQGVPVYGRGDGSTSALLTIVPGDLRMDIGNGILTGEDWYDAVTEWESTLTGVQYPAIGTFNGVDVRLFNDWLFRREDPGDSASGIDFNVTPTTGIEHDDEVNGSVAMRTRQVRAYDSAGGDVLGATVEGPLDVRAVLRIVLAVLAGKTSITDLGGGSAEVAFRDVADTKDRVFVELTDSERTSVTLDGD